MWAFGRHDLRLSESEFWDLTLAQFVALSRQHRNAQRRMDYRAALVCTVLANTHSRRRFKPEDFMPGIGRPGRKTPEQMFNVVKSLHKRLTRNAGRNK